jgi:hypothetical protein
MKSSNVGNSITPPPELVQQWTKLYEDGKNLQSLFYGIFEAGANQELEACCEWFQEFYKTESWVDLDLRSFRLARRPNPPSLKEQALEALAEAIKMADDAPPEGICSDQANIIRRALEQLSDEQ